MAKRKNVAAEFRALEALVVEFVPLDSVRPNSYNPNRQSDEDFALLLQSMQDNGFTQPIIVNKEGIIVDGFHRWRAAREMGMTEIPVVRVDFTDEQMRLSTLRHNRARGQDDLDLLSAMLRDLAKLGGLESAQQQLGLSQQELEGLIGNLTAAEELGDAAGEYNTAWEPTSGQNGSIEGMVSDTRMVGTSAGAQQQAANVEAAVKALPQGLTVMERVEQEKAIRKELVTTTFRLNMVFTGDKASLVKGVLGEKPSMRFLELCQRVLA